MLGWIAGGLALVAIASYGIHEVIAKIEEDGYRAGEEACVAQAANDNAAAVDRLHKQLENQRQATDDAHGRAQAAHKALEAERAAHAVTQANMCHEGCTVHIPAEGGGQ